MSDVSHETESLTYCVDARLAMQIEQKRRGERKHVRHGGTLCSRCLAAPRGSAKSAYCHPCNAIVQKEARRMAKTELMRLRALEKSLPKQQSNKRAEEDGKSG